MVSETSHADSLKRHCFLHIYILNELHLLWIKFYFNCTCAVKIYVFTILGHKIMELNTFLAKIQRYIINSGFFFHKKRRQVKKSLIGKEENNYGTECNPIIALFKHNFCNTT